ncbi:uncharacterized protein LOC130428827 isoform X2 [Triplophysa dalaica]|uniref:uncharacterized protein LOC130428827 isoform X2 n=1 Tax=Triplophysa dalaica TaxID=1582913 RepID=UPI0024E03ACF|nr:uncharacterized protein LOC130428827 isoform X2 [Triplophysa dalaica]
MNGYNIVIFGGIDGFSRKIMYLGAASNNLAATSLAFFQESVEKFGFPLRVRADQGVENVDIARLMFTVRGTGRGSFTSGKSVHNQRFPGHFPQWLGQSSDKNRRPYDPKSAVGAGPNPSPNSRPRKYGGYGYSSH